MKRNSIRKLSPSDAKEVAKRNITNKIVILESWIRDGVPLERDPQGRAVCDDAGHQLYVYTPNSLRSFNTWASQLYSGITQNNLDYISTISGNGTDTLNRYPELKERAVSLMKYLGELLEQRRQSAQNIIPKLELEIKSLNFFIQNQNGKIIQFQKENITLQRTLALIEKRDKGSFEELKLNYTTLEKQNIRLREEVSILTKQLNGIHSLREISREQ